MLIILEYVHICNNDLKRPLYWLPIDLSGNMCSTNATSSTGDIKDDHLVNCFYSSQLRTPNKIIKDTLVNISNFWKSGATWWPILKTMQVAPSGDKIWMQVAPSGGYICIQFNCTNTSSAKWKTNASPILWPNLEQIHVIPNQLWNMARYRINFWVRCVPGNVFMEIVNLNKMHNVYLYVIWNGVGEVKKNMAEDDSHAFLGNFSDLYLLYHHYWQCDAAADEAKSPISSCYKWMSALKY